MRPLPSAKGWMNTNANAETAAATTGSMRPSNTVTRRVKTAQASRARASSSSPEFIESRSFGVSLTVGQIPGPPSRLSATRCRREFRCSATT